VDRRGVSGRDGAAAAALLAVAVAFWGGSFRATAAATEHTSGLVLSALRALPAALILVVAVPLAGSRLPRGRLWIWAAVTGLLGVTLFFYGLSEATALAGPGNAAVLANTPPFFVLVLGWLFLDERITPAALVGLAVGFGGVVIMVSSQLGGDRGTKDLVLGMALALAAAAGWGVTTLQVKWLAEREPDLDVLGLTAGQFVVGGAVLGVLAFAVDGTGGTDWGSGSLWAALAWLAVGASAVAYFAFFAALKRATATAVSTSLFLVPVVAVLVEAVRGNPPGAVVGIGMALAVAGVALVMFAPQLDPAASRSSRTAESAP
jgi:drug/metabolite transporter (DMT)-like permease